MTLEDFFSTAEMKNGLTAPSRVEELISLMQKQKDCAAINPGDAARQWLTIANTLASTEDEECLNHLVQLNGLFFLNQWLQEALNCSHDAAVSEEIINALFKSLEKLPLCKEKLNTSGILVTVKKLIGHKLVNIKERAQTFFERWADERVNDDTIEEAEKGSSNLVDNSKASPDEASIEDKRCLDISFDSSPTLTAVDEGGCRVQLGYNENIVDDGLKGSIPYQTVFESTFIENEKCTLPSTSTSECNACQEKFYVDESYVASLGLASYTAPDSQKAHEQCLHSAIKNDDRIDTEANGGNGVSHESEHSKTLKEFKSGQNVVSHLLLLREAGDFTCEFNNLGNELSLKACKEVDVLTFGDLHKTSNDMVTEALDNKSHLALESEEVDAVAVKSEVVDYKDQSCNSLPEVIPRSSPEVIPRDFFSSESRDIVENNKFDHHIVEPNVVSEDLDCELSLIPFNPVNLFAPLIVSGSNGAPGLPFIPLHLECELGLRSSAATSALHPPSPTNALDGENMKSDSEAKGIFSEIDLSLEMGPLLVKELHVPYDIPSMYPSLELSSERAKTIQLGLNCVKEEEEDPSFLQLSSSTQPSMINLDLNDDSFVFNSDPFYTILDSRMIIDRRDELSTRTVMMGIEESTPSSSNWVPDLDLNSGMMQIENGSGEQGTLMQLFMPESRNLLGEERKTLKRKDPYGFGYNQLKLKL